MKLGKFICFWCDNLEHRRSPLLFDVQRESFVHRQCARPRAELREVRRVRATKDGTIESIEFGGAA